MKLTVSEIEEAEIEMRGGGERSEEVKELSRVSLSKREEL